MSASSRCASSIVSHAYSFSGSRTAPSTEYDTYEYSHTPRVSYRAMLYDRTRAEFSVPWRLPVPGPASVRVLAPDARVNTAPWANAQCDEASIASYRRVVRSTKHEYCTVLALCEHCTSPCQIRSTTLNDPKALRTRVPVGCNCSHHLPRDRPWAMLVFHPGTCSCNHVLVTHPVPMKCLARKFSDKTLLIGPRDLAVQMS